MGIGVVLLFWFALFGLMAAVASVFLGVASYLIQARLGRPVLRKWVVTFVLFPFLTVGYVAVAFAAYATWCEKVRHVDPGIGDSWQVPLPNGYRLVMIDRPDQAFIESKERRQHSGIRQLAVAGDAIYARDASSLFRVDTKSSAETVVERSPAELVSPIDYYDAHRWTNEDREAAIVGPALPVVAFLLLCVSFLRAIFRRGGERDPWRA